VLALLIAGLGIVSYFAVIRRPDSDLANYRALVQVVGSCSSFDCISSAGDEVSLGVLRDEAFAFFLVPFLGNDDLAVAALTIAIYAGLVFGILRICAAASLLPDVPSATFIFAAVLTIIPITLATHLLRQCVAMSLVVLAGSVRTKLHLVALITLAVVIHRGAATIGIVALLVPTSVLVGAVLLALPFWETLIPPDVATYATTEQRANVLLIYVFAALCVVLYVKCRKISPTAARLALGAGVQVLAVTLAFGEGLAATRTLTSSLIIALPAAVVFVLSIAHSFPRQLQAFGLFALAMALVVTSGLRDAASPFTYDFPRW